MSDGYSVVGGRKLNKHYRKLAKSVLKKKQAIEEKAVDEHERGEIGWWYRDIAGVTVHYSVQKGNTIVVFLGPVPFKGEDTPAIKWERTYRSDDLDRSRKAQARYDERMAPQRARAQRYPGCGWD